MRFRTCLPLETVQRMEKLTTFCPILGEYDLINSVEKMLVTAERLEEVINQIRKIDFSVFLQRSIIFRSGQRN